MADYELPEGFEVVKPVVPTVDKPFNFGLPEGFVPVEQPLFPEAPPEEQAKMRESIIGKTFAGIPSAAMGLVTFPADVVRTVGGIPSAYNELRNDPKRTVPPPNKLTAALASPLISALNTFTRGVPEEERNAAKARLIASTVGGVGGGSAGMIAGAPFGPPGMIIGGTIGAIGGGVGGDRYGREKLQEAKLAPEEDQWEEDKQDVANLLLSAGMGKVANVTKSITGNRAGRSAYTAKRRMEEIERATDPASLQAQALIGKSKDSVIRPPRRGTPDNIILGRQGGGKTIPSIEATIDGTPENLIAKELLDYENSLSGDLAPTTFKSELPTTDSPQKIKIEGDTTSGVIDVAQAEPAGILPFKKDRDTNQYYLDQALSEPGVQEAMEYVRTGKGSEFDTLIPKVKEQQLKAKNSNIELMNKVPVDKYPEAGEVLFRKFDEKLQKSNVPQAEKKAYYDVFYDELGGLMPRILGWADGDLRGEEFRMLLNKKRNSEKGGSRQINDLAGGIVSKLSPEENIKLNGYFKELREAPMSPLLMDELKSKFSDLGGYDKQGSSGLGVDTDSNRAKAYKLISDNLRNSVESVVYQTLPDEFPTFRDNNRKSQIFNTVERLASARAREERQFGRGRKLEQFKIDTEGEYPLNPFPYVSRAIKNYFIPQPTSREAMLRQADKDPFNRGTGYMMFNAPKWANRGYQISDKLSEGIESYQTKTTTRTKPSEGMKLPARPGIEPYIANEAVLSDDDKARTGIGAIDRFVNKTAAPFINEQVQDLFDPYRLPIPPTQTPVQEKLPRKTELMTSDNMAKFLQGTMATPEKAPIAQGLVKKMVEASNVGDMDKVEKIHADMVKLFPEQFESGFGVNGKVFHPDDQAKIMDNLKKLKREGVVDNIQLAKQRNAFADPMDGRILPTQPKQFNPSQQPHTMVNGTRRYSY